MQVAITQVTGNAGYHYVLLIDPVTYQAIAEVQAGVNNGIYSYSFTNVKNGNYLIIAGTDSNNDFIICDPGEACGAYISIDMPKPVTVNNNDLEKLDLNTSFEISLSEVFTSSEKRQGFIRIKGNKNYLREWE